MEKVEEKFYVNRKSREIWSRCVWSRKFVRDLTASEVENILAHDEPEVFINEERDQLMPVLREDVSSLWASRLCGHIVENLEDFTPLDFEDGYCFGAQLWKSKSGRKLLVLSYHH